MVQIIKKIIAWIIDLFSRLFKRKQSNRAISLDNNVYKDLGKKNKINHGISNEELPPYLIISNQDKQLLINNIQKLKQSLINNYSKDSVIERIITLLDKTNEEELDSIKKQLNNQDFEKFNVKKVAKVLNDFNVDKKQIEIILENTIKDNEFVKKAIYNINNLIEHVRENDISVGTKDNINNKVLKFSFNEKVDKEITSFFDKDIINVIKDWDKSIIFEVKSEYEKVNYVTITTVLVDKIIEKYNHIIEDYQSHHYNKYYYERELNKIKKQIDYLQNIKNQHSVQIEIERLRKELYSKSKDKYDLLYNNEIFMNINRQCDELLTNINQRIIDIKKDPQDVLENKDEKQKQEYLKNIILRFQDINLAKELILSYYNKNQDIKDNIVYIDMAYKEFLNELDAPFNFSKNKTKTELVKLYNDLNKVIYSNKKEPCIVIEHINFKMDDLINAVIIKKEEITNLCPFENEWPNSKLVDEKTTKIHKKYLKVNNKKLMKKTYSS